MDATLDLNQGNVPVEELQERLEAVPEALTNTLTDAIVDIGARLQGAAAENAPVDTGQLRASLEFSYEEHDGSFRLVVGSNHPGAGAMEAGTDPGHFPPPSELRDWARRVLGDESAAFPVARAIAETGLEGRRYLRDAFEDNMDYIISRLNDGVKEAFVEVGLA